MDLTVSTDRDQRLWCLWCPDLILATEPAATHPDLHDLVGDQGYGHVDCALDAGYTVPDTVTLTGDALGRYLFRDLIRRKGPIRFEMP